MSKNQLLNEARELDYFFFALTEDVKRSLDLWCDLGDEFSRKTYVRTAFALVEGMIQRFKSVSLLINGMLEEPILSSEEVTLLKEEQVALKQNGEVNISTMKIPLLSNFRFAIKMYCKVHRSKYELDCSDQGWEAFHKAIKVRDRITHPRTMSDFLVSNNDMALVEEGLSFFREATLPLISGKI